MTWSGIGVEQQLAGDSNVAGELDVMDAPARRLDAVEQP